MLSFIKRLFQKKKHKENTPPLPPFDAIVEMMYTQNSNFSANQSVEVIYSHDKTKRYIITEGDDGLFRYTAESIYVFDEDEWRYVCEDKNALPAMWQPYSIGSSIFDSRENALKEIYSEPLYKNHFL